MEGIELASSSNGSVRRRKRPSAAPTNNLSYNQHLDRLNNDKDNEEISRGPNSFKWWFKNLGIVFVISGFLAILMVLISYTVKDTNSTVNVNEYCNFDDFGECITRLQELLRDDSTSLRRPTHFFSSLSIFLVFIFLYQVYSGKKSLGIERQLQSLPKTEIDIFSKSGKSRPSAEIFDKIVRYIVDVRNLKLLQIDVLTYPDLRARNPEAKYMDSNWGVGPNNQEPFSYRNCATSSIFQLSDLAGLISPELFLWTHESAREYMDRIKQYMESFNECEELDRPPITIDSQLFNKYVVLYETAKYSKLDFTQDHWNQFLNAFNHIYTSITALEHLDTN